jgi:hypothetical protein
MAYIDTTASTNLKELRKLKRMLDQINSPIERARTYVGMVMEKVRGSAPDDFRKLKDWLNSPDNKLTFDQRAIRLLADFELWVHTSEVCQRTYYDTYAPDDDDD